MSIQPLPSLTGPKPKALFFDLMGTSFDWHPSIVPVLLSALSSSPIPKILATRPFQTSSRWRAGFCEEIHRRFVAGYASEDIDVTHRRVLDRLLEEKGVD
jgi:FMN phosphatase YigB (HAD superfamily)